MNELVEQVKQLQDDALQIKRVLVAMEEEKASGERVAHLEGQLIRIDDILSKGVEASSLAAKMNALEEHFQAKNRALQGSMESTMGSKAQSIQDAVFRLETQVLGMCAVMGLDEEKLMEAGSEIRAVREAERRAIEAGASEAEAQESTANMKKSGALAAAGRHPMRDMMMSDDMQHLSKQVSICIDLMQGKADAEEVGDLREEIAQIQDNVTRVDLIVQGKATANDADQIGKDIKRFKAKLNDLETSVFEKADMTLFRDVRADTDSCKKEVALIRNLLREKAGPKDMDYLLDSVQGIRTQLTTVERISQDKADKEKFLTHASTLTSLKVQVEGFEKTMADRALLDAERHASPRPRAKSRAGARNASPKRQR